MVLKRKGGVCEIVWIKKKMIRKKWRELRQKLTINVIGLIDKKMF